jgi:hypothetical protein
MAGRMYASITTNGGKGQPATLTWILHAVLGSEYSGCTGTSAHACPQVTNAVIEQEIPYDVGTTSFGAYYPSVHPDRGGNYTMVFNFSGSSYYGSTVYVSNRVTRPPNTWGDTGIFLRTGSAYYPYGRWGDYTAAVLDLTSPNVIWFSGMYTMSNGYWGTWIGKNGFTAANQP